MPTSSSGLERRSELAGTSKSRLAERYVDDAKQVDTFSPAGDFVVWLQEP